MSADQVRSRAVAARPAMPSLERKLPPGPRQPAAESGVKARAWDEVEAETVGDYDVFRVRRHVMRSPRTGDLHEFHVVDVPLCVQVIPFTGDGQVVLVEQYRQGVKRLSLEFPAGVVEDGEDPVEAAVRELEEETGYRAAEAELLIDFDPDPAIQSNAITVIVARGCTLRGRRDQDDGEDVHVRVADVAEIDALIRDGRIRHAAAISAWHLYGALRARD
jgi:ADP-ribose pyrophosphatase